MTLIGAPGLTRMQDLARLVRAAVKDKSYEQTPLGKPAAKYLRRKSLEQNCAESTMWAYEQAVAWLCVYYPTRELADFEGRPGRDLIVEFIQARWGQRHPATRVKVTRILNDFFKYAVREEWMRNNPIDLMDKPRVESARRGVYEKGEPQRLIEAATRAEEKAALAIMVEFGIRKEEMRTLQLKDYSPGNRILTVKGKRGKTRYLPVVDEGLARRLETHWLERAAAGHSGEAYLLYPISRGMVNNPDGGKILATTSERVYEPKSKSTVHMWFKRMLALAGIPDDRKIHELRHTAATELIRATKDVPAAQAMLGHASIATTQIYTHMTQDDLVEALHLLAVSRGQATIETLKLDAAEIGILLEWLKERAVGVDFDDASRAEAFAKLRQFVAANNEVLG